MAALPLVRPLVHEQVELLLWEAAADQPFKHPHYFFIEAREKSWCCAPQRSQRGRERHEIPLSPAAYFSLAPQSMVNVGSVVRHGHGELTAVLAGWPPTVCFSI